MGTFYACEDGNEHDEGVLKVICSNRGTHYGK